MNKKILSLAVAAAMAAPMVAQADVKISGAIQREMLNLENFGLVGGDFGTSKLNIDFSEGDVFGKVAWDIRQNYMMATDTQWLPTPSGGSTAITSFATPLVQREQYAGVKVGGGSIMLGRIGNLASKVIYGADSLNATFLEARGAAGGTTKVSSFDSGMVQFGMKAGDVTFNVAYGPAYKDMTGGENPTQANAFFKAGPATIGIAYDKDKGNGDTTALSAKMKFGDVSVAALAEDDSAAGTSVFVDAGMPLGGVNLDLGLGTNTTASTNWYRIAVVKNMGKGRVFAGYSNPDGGPARTGVGVTVKF